MAKTTFYPGVDAPEKIVLVAGPSFGQAFKFMLLGAALGAGGVYYLLGSKTKPGEPKTSAGAPSVVPNPNYEAALEDFAAPRVPASQSSGTPAEIADRVGALTSRLKVLGSRAKELVETAGEAVKPTLESALAEGKRVAAETQSKLKKDVTEAGDRPAIAEQDGELPSEREDKFIE